MSANNLEIAQKLSLSDTRTNLPGGFVRRARSNEVCDAHPEESAFAVIQGETDSFGYEPLLMCADCYVASRSKKNTDTWFTGDCDHCDAKNVELVGVRDPDEGLNGPVYPVCRSCRAAQREREREEWEREQKENDQYLDEPLEDVESWYETIED